MTLTILTYTVVIVNILIDMIFVTTLAKILSVIVICGFWTLCDGTHIYVTAVDNVQDDIDITQYVAFPANNKYLKFQLKACRDGVLSLYSRNETGNPHYRIIIGGWGGYKSVLSRQHNVTQFVDVFEGYGKVDCSLYKEFWISWTNGKIQIGEGKTLGADVFMSYQESCPFDINRITIGTTQGATVYYILYPSSDGNGSQENLQLDNIYTENLECPTFQPITTIQSSLRSECAYRCYTNENCKGFAFSTNTGLCQLVSRYALNTVLTSYLMSKK